MDHTIPGLTGYYNYWTEHVFRGTMAERFMAEVIPPVPAPVPTSAPQVAVQTAATTEDEKFFAALGYFGFLFVIPLIVKPKSAFCRFHAKQSMVMFLAAIIVITVLATVPFIGSLLTLALFALYVVAVYRAYKGDSWNIPFISEFAGKMNVEAMYGKAGLALNSISGLKDKVQDLTAKGSESLKNLGGQEMPAPPVETKTPPTAPPPSQPPTV